MRKLLSITTIILASLSTNVHALGLGNIEMLSALNQPLEAEIELLSVREGETDGMIATLGSQEAFLRAGLDRPFILTQLRFNVEERNDGTPYIRVISKKPIVEPFLNFLIEVDWPRGRLVREYTVLLDPPVFMTQQAESSQPSQSATVETTVAAETTVPAPEPISPTPEPVTAPEPEPAPSSESTSTVSTASESSTVASSVTEYGPVAEGETLWSIASRNKPASMTIEQMMIAISRANPDAFLRDNINLLRKGAILRIPQGDTQISQSEAVESVREQTALWNEYVDSVQPRTQEPVVEEVAEQTPNVEETVESTEQAESELKLVGEEDATEQAADAVTAERAEAAENALSNVQAQLSLAQEEVEAEKLRNDELQSRVASLEDTVSKMERLITLRETELAELQQQLSDAEQAAVETVTVETVEVEPQATEIEVTEPEPEPEVVEPEVVEPEVVEVEPVAETVEVVEPEVVPEPEVIAVPEPEPEVVAEPEPEPVPVPVVTPPRQPSFLEQMMGSSTALLAGGGLLVLLLALMFMLRRRRAAAEDEELAGLDDDIELDVEDDNLGQIGGDIGGDTDFADDLDITDDVSSDTDATVQSFEDDIDDADDFGSDFLDDTDNDATLNNIDDDEALNALDTASTVIIQPEAAQEFVTAADESEREAVADSAPVKDDTIAEADVYLAYGLFGQAEDLLKLAIEENPNKAEYHVKLAETYYAEKNKDAFVGVAENAQTKIGATDPAAWERIASMGHELAPDNELFGGAGPIAQVAPELGINMDEPTGGEKFESELDLDATQLLEAAEYEETRPLDDEKDADLIASRTGGGGDLDDMKTMIMTPTPSPDEPAPAPAAASGEADMADFGLDDDPATEKDDTVIDDILERGDVTPAINDAMEFDIDDLDSTGDLTGPGTELDPESTDLDFESDIDMDLSLEDLDLDGDDTADLTDGDETDPLADMTDRLGESEIETLDLGGSDDLDMPPQSEIETAVAPATEGDGIDADVDDDVFSDLDDAMLSVENDDLVTGASTDGLDATMALDQEFDTTADRTTDVMDDDFELDGGGEIDTMLDLAKAYIDMGDADSASSALKEIIATGNDAQKAEAENLLKQLS
ncbi:MAG: FimV/HubP family polar landmark protein [Pseudomonadota bacterium]